MTRFSRNTLTGHSEAPASTEPAQLTGPTQPRRLESKVSHIMDSVQHALSHGHEKLPSDNEAGKHHAQQQTTASGANGSISPAIQAVASSKLDENNMGENSHQKDKAWGWPGLGTFSSNDPIATQKMKPRIGSTESGAHTESRVEAATFEAIDNAAETEAYGWPGLGGWTSSSRK